MNDKKPQDFTLLSAITYADKFLLPQVYLANKRGNRKLNE